MLESESVESGKGVGAQPRKIGKVGDGDETLAAGSDRKREEADEVKAEGGQERGDPRRALATVEEQDAGLRREGDTAIVHIGKDLEVTR